MDSTKTKRISRLTAILTQLQAKRLVTATELAARYAVSIRTIYRDIRTLEEAGIPIVTEEGKGYSMMEGYKLPPVMFTEEEASALLTAEHLIHKNKDRSLAEHYESAVTKIKSILKLSQQTKIEFLSDRIQIRNNQEEERTSNYLIQLQSVIANFQVVKITYRSLKNHESERKIEPFALYTTQGNWILIAFCRDKEDFRAFRLDRIQRLQLTSEYFEPHTITLEEYLEACRKKWQTTPDTPMTPGQFTFAENQKKLNMQTVKIEPFKVMGISIRTTNEGGKAAVDIAELWQKFMSENVAAKLPNKVDDTVYSLYTDYEGDHTGPYTAMLCCKVDDLNAIPEGMIGRSFGGGNYVQFTAKGDLANGLIVKEWQKIWGMGLDRAFTTDFEVFGEKAQNPSDAEVDFLIAVK